MLAASRHRRAQISEILADHKSQSDTERSLVVEANPHDLVDARMALMEAEYAKIDVAISLRLAFELVKDNRYSVILVDYFLPDGDGLELLDWMDADSEVIMIAGNAGAAKRIVTRVPLVLTEPAAASI